MDFYLLEERNSGWVKGLEEAAPRHGHKYHRIQRGSEVTGPGIGFIRPHADPEVLKRNIKDDDPAMRKHLLMVQDRAQVEVYDNKSAQFQRWGKWMPYTKRYTDRLEALDGVAEFFTTDTSQIVVSKADCGASSKNVRILKNIKEARNHINEVFQKGIRVNHCAGGAGTAPAWSVQKDYVLLQEFVPQNKFTWRVNRVGDLWAIFKRHNYPDKPVAQTGNTEPVMKLDRHMEHLLDFCSACVRDLQSKWVALDVLWYPDYQRKGNGTWMLLETSLAYPWPSPGKCNENVFWDLDYNNTGRNWLEMFDVMFEQIEEGVWGDLSKA